MKFLIDRCAGRRIAEWLSSLGHDVIETRSLGQDPGDRVILEWAAGENRILVTVDTDFGKLVYVNGARHCGPSPSSSFPSWECSSTSLSTAGR